MSADIKPNDLRLFAIQNRAEITYRVRRAEQVCVVNPQGIIKIPGLAGPPPYNVEEVLARADEFTLARSGQKAQTLGREEMAALLKARTPARAAAPAEKEE